MLSLWVGCATPVARPSGSTREVVIAHDDGRPTGSMAFPNQTYEAVVRFQLPDGEYQPLRIRLQAQAAGQVEISVYENTLFESPGDALFKVDRDLGAADLSNGRDGRWAVEDLRQMKPIKGVVWVGVRKKGGTPTIWASSVVSGQAFVRDNNPQNPMGLLPTKRTPMLRLEITP